MYESIFARWENFEKLDIENNLSILFQYAVLFRNWEKAYELRRNIDINKVSYKPVVINDEIVFIEHKSITIKNCIAWNFGYLKKYDENNKINMESSLLNGVSDMKELAYYSDKIDEGNDVFDLFFLKEQPMFDVIYYKQQEKASKQIKALNINLIFDEVGTGKTVSALYCVRDIISERQEDAKILIICPNNKKNEWLKDIERQLGRYTHLVENTDNENIYYHEQKKLYFQNHEPCIFIEGQKTKETKATLNSWTNDTKWDLVVIDEGHLCFDNYKQLRAKRAVLLTATPIVVNSAATGGVLDISKIRTIPEYATLLNGITDSNNVCAANLFENNYNKLPADDKSRFFTCLFREDLDIPSKRREIKFLVCKRWPDRSHYLDVLREVKGGMTGLVYEQDDDYLIEGIFGSFKSEIEEKGYLIGQRPRITNHKYEELKSYINNTETQSYIIFCNYKFVANNIYNKFINDQGTLKNIGNTIFVKKYGSDNCEVFPKDNSVNKDNIFDYLMMNIEAGKRVIFITTGASGGTGLNLGKFDGVINYELPFTCIELEQRFGRVDRLNNKVQSKKMIFILNEHENPMLRYSTLKISETCKHMPIRNTVLFYPEFIKESIKGLLTELEKCKIELEQNNGFLSVLEKYTEVLEAHKNLAKRLIDYAFKKRSVEDFEEDVSDIKEFAEVFNDNLTAVFSVINKKRNFYALIDEVENWKNLLGADTQIDTKAVAASLEKSDDELSEYTQRDGNLISSEVVVQDMSKSKSIDELWQAGDVNFKINCQMNELTNLKEKVISQEGTSGIFYIYNKKYIRQTVADFRRGEV
ncbi:SNF2-related protein [Paenibacillus qinlingensis]|uniref:SNF2-related protein n=1 Tax=Paenibacillus qinlingensis TaxID=1837343 RepID=UPI0015653785|nr:SNF2-related protein [Paenibacillus qinlingensis]NQX62598.1 DEAD/DEAH box helicase family protein [Paenibacillus qinlingensis]